MTTLPRFLWKVILVLFIFLVVFHFSLFELVNLSYFRNPLSTICENSAYFKKKSNTTADIVKQITTCKDTIQVPHLKQKGDYWAYYNFHTSKIQFSCSESITYTTHGDFTFLYNLETLAKRWNGPISIALYAPGDDYRKTVDSIRYFKHCGSEIIDNFVTFHIYFSTSHMPPKILKSDYLLEPYDCGLIPPFQNVNKSALYKTLNNLPYPINVGRNIARETAPTYFVLASDVELYPSKGIIPKFLDMITRNEPSINKEDKKVFPLSLFEVGETEKVPETKTELLEMLKKGTAIAFHKKICPTCHTVPKYKEWINAKEENQLNVFTVSKRTGLYSQWEPIYIATNNEPFYEERLTWDGKRDKMTQAYSLCVSDYSFMVLDNVFLVHRPGIKVYKADPNRQKWVYKTNELIRNTISKELKLLFGEKSGCVI